MLQQQPVAAPGRLDAHQGRIVSDGPPENALSPRVLKTAFGLKAQWVEAGDQRLLLAERA